MSNKVDTVGTGRTMTRRPRTGDDERSGDSSGRRQRTCAPTTSGSRGPFKQPRPADSDGRYELSVSQRVVLSCLARNGGETGLVALARDVAAHRLDIPADEVSPHHARQMYRCLSSSVVDALVEQDLVRYDERAGTVRLVSDPLISQNNRSILR